MIPDPLNDLIEEATSWQTIAKPRNHDEAVTWAKGVFDRLSNKGAFAFEAEQNSAFVRLTYQLALNDPEQYRRLASTKAIWFDGLKVVCAEMLRRGDDLPVILCEWLADLLAENVRRPKRMGGRHNTSVHQAAMWMAVSQLVKWKWKATRNDVSPPVSACDVVAQAVGLTFDRVKEVTEKPWVRPKYFLRDWDFSRAGKTK